MRQWLGSPHKYQATAFLVRNSVMAEQGCPQRQMIVAGLLIQDNRVLLGHRSASREWFPEVWDLPGGHIEDDEKPGEALQRELREELGIDVPDPGSQYLARFVTEEIDLRVCVVSEWTGTPINASPIEHDQIAWFESSQLNSIDLALEFYAALLTDALGRASMLSRVEVI